MQIHDITKRRKTNEGLLDSLKAGIAGAKEVGSAAYNASKAVGQAVTSPTFGAVTRNQGNLDAADKSRKAIEKKYGITIPGAQRGAGEMYAGQSLEKTAQALTNKFKETPEFADIIDTGGETLGQQSTQQKSAEPAASSQVDIETPYVEPGYKLTVPSVVSGYPTDYYIGTDGLWRNGFNQQITDQPTITKLNGIANQGQDSGRIKPTRLPADQQAKQKQSKQKATQSAKPATQVKPVAEGSLAQRAAARNVRSAPLNTAPTPTQPSAPQATAGNGDANLVNAITATAEPTLQKIGKEFETTPDAVKGRPEVQAALKKLINVSKAKVKQGKDARVAAAYKDYTLSVLQAMKAVGTGEDSAASEQDSTPNPQQEKLAQQQLATSGLVDQQALTKVKDAVTKNPQTKPLVKQAIGLDEQLSRELRKLRFSTLYEDSVQITKDIIVKTNLGNYVKKAEDQTWYDPNGVPIDPVKYADYIKKLDATPAAQTRYQADSIAGHGSDTAFSKAKNPPPPAQAPAPQAAPDPIQQMADQQKMAAIMRSRDVAGLNAMINDTFNQLQNAKIFNTGQEPYLKDRMAQLMAMKV